MKRAIFFLLLIPVSADADGLPLFVSDEPLEIVFEFPLREVLRKAAERPVVDGVAHYVDEDGMTVSVPVKMSTRGKSRLAVCRFPPLSLSLKKKQVMATVFEGQKSLKIVTHCRDNSRYRNYILQEYGVYEALNVLTDVSFRTRLLEVTYRDSDDKEYEITESAFFIESIGEVAARTALERQRVPAVRTDQLDPRHAAVVAMFQYMIGNTDWSPKEGPGDSDCCHNGRVLGPAGQPAGWMVVPYDFDQAGVVNTDYAKPPPQLRLRSVRQRLWRGRCAHSDQLDDVIVLFNERREDIESALLVPGLRDPQNTRKYVAGFYNVINDPKRRAQNIDRRCLRN